MKKYLYLFLLVIGIVVLIAFILLGKDRTSTEQTPDKTDSETLTPSIQDNDSEDTITTLPNPASKYCEDNGGKLEIVTNNDGSQLEMCQFEEYSCEEWAYMNGDCTIEEDEAKIKDALIQKGLNLTGMKIVIHKHFGKYIAGGVVPVDMLGGGGYVFAEKDKSGNLHIVADGNGAIMCTMLEEYPDFPTYLIPECIDATGNPVSR